VSPLRKRPCRQSRQGLFSDVASDVAVLSVRGGGRHAAGAEAIPEEGGSWGKHGFPHASEPKASDDHPGSWLNLTSVEPTVIVSPSLSLARFTRFPFTSSPLVEPRSTIQ